MRNFWGLMRAYWFSESWKEAWTLTLIIMALTAAGSKAAVWIAEASGELVNSIAYFHDARNPSPGSLLMTSAITLVALVIMKEIAFVGIRHLFSTTLHRRWRAWLDRQFNDALLDQNHTHFHVQHEGRTGAEVRQAPDNIEQRVQDSIKDFAGGALGLAMGIFGVFTSLYFVGSKLIETSTAVEGLAFLGIYGSAVLAFAAVGAYVPVNTWIAVKVGGLLQRLTISIQQAEASYRGELTVLLRRSFQVAATRGEDVQRNMHSELYKDIDSTWGKLNIVHSGYMSFERIYEFLASRIVAYGPGLIPYMSGNIGLKSYITGAELVNSLIVQCSWFINVMPAIATLRANSQRITGLAQAIEDVQRPDDYYRQTGRSDFRFSSQDRAFGLTLRGLELYHEGKATEPFVRAVDLRFRRGEWACLMGASGSGKTSLMKAVNGLWPHGAGEIVRPSGENSFYATQDVKLPRLTLKRLVCLPEAEDRFSDARVASVLHKAGIGEFIEFLDKKNRDGKAWEDVLSGGQKQKLVLARILLHAPGLLFLDEATSALDPAAKIAFHQAIRDNCPHTTILSIMHEPQPPRMADGREFYDSIVRFANGAATKAPISARALDAIKVVSGASEGGGKKPAAGKLSG